MTEIIAGVIIAIAVLWAGERVRGAITAIRVETITMLLERIQAIKAAHDKKVADDAQEVADRDAKIAALQAKIDAGLQLTAEEEAAMEALESDVGIAPA